MIRHKKCGGEIMVDLSDFFTIASPSVAFAVDGLTFGALEIADSSKRNSKLKFVCRDCKDAVEVADIEISCDVCQKFHSLKDMSVVRNYGVFCNSCISVLKGEKEPTNDRQRHTLRYYKIPAETTTVPVSNVITLPFNTI